MDQMKHGAHTLLFIIASLLLAIHSYAKEEPKDKNKKEPKVENEKDKKIDMGRSSNSHTDDTLVFDKTVEDTLIFADDEMKMSDDKNKGNNENKSYRMNKSSMSDELHSALFPNPCNGSSTIEINVPDGDYSEITVMSMLGTLISMDTFMGKVYEIKNISSGTYYIIIKNHERVVQKKLFVN